MPTFEQVTVEGEPPAAVPRLALNAVEAAKAVGVSVKTIRRAYWRGDLPCVRLGTRVRFLPADLEHWLESQRAAG